MGNKSAYWTDLADYDIETARAMLQTGRYLYVGFMCHQAVEKVLKAVIAGAGASPPKIHGLMKLARQGEIYNSMNEEQKDLLDTLDPLNIATRYPEQRAKSKARVHAHAGAMRGYFSGNRGIAVLDKATAIDLAQRYAFEVEKFLKPRAIVLYGSYANGTASEYSDIDIAVILDGFSGDYLETSKQLYKLRRNISADIEPVLLDSTLDENGFVAEVLRTGQVLRNH